MTHQCNHIINSGQVIEAKYKRPQTDKVLYTSKVTDTLVVKVQFCNVF